MTSANLRIAIVGAGMCGLACAIPLARAGLDVAVFEQAKVFEEIGAGVGLGPNAIKALRLLGLLDAVLAKSQQPSLKQRVFRFIEGMGDHKLIYDYGDSVPAAESVGLGIYRPAFLEALIPLLPPDITQFDKRCVKVIEEPNGLHPYTLEFADGTTYVADLIIGADGIKSIVRSYVAPPVPTDITSTSDRVGFSNIYAYRGLVQMRDLQEAGVKIVDQLRLRPHGWLGKNKHFITFPIKGGETLNIVAFVRTQPVPPHQEPKGTNTPPPSHSVLPADKTLTSESPIPPALPYPWVVQVPTDQVLKEFDDWGSDAQTMLGFMKGASRWSIHMVWPPLDAYSKPFSGNVVESKDGGIVLVGDAAHAMQPHLGAGVGQGLEDVYVLSRLLIHQHNHPESMNLKTLLETYDSLRVERANDVAARSMRNGEIYEGYDLTEGSHPDESSREEARREYAQKLKGTWEPVWSYDFDGRVETALGLATFE